MHILLADDSRAFALPIAFRAPILGLDPTLKKTDTPAQAVGFPILADQWAGLMRFGTTLHNPRKSS